MIGKARFAFSIPTSNGAEQRRLFDEYGPAGFAGLQMKGGQYARYLDEPRRFLDEWGGGAAGANSALIYGGALDDEGVASLRRVFQFAGAIGSERVIFCHGRSRATVSDDDIRQFARQLATLGEEARQHGVALSLHHHYDQPVMRRADFDTFFEALPLETVGLTIDTAHLVKSGVADIPGLLWEFAGFIDNVHLKDFAEGQFKTLGTGDIDFGPIFAALRGIDYDGWLCADEESGLDVGESLRVSADFLRHGWQGEWAK